MRSICKCGMVLAALLACATAQTQPYPARPHAGMHFDARYGSGHYYARPGTFVRVVPGRPYIVPGGRYYYSGGVWYAPRGSGFVVIGPPRGIFVPVLPPFYSTLWVNGVPYYYANDTYYMWNSGLRSYEVVAPPPDPTDATTAAPPNDNLYIYPRSGQSAEQQKSDQYECHTWANTQTGYDPTKTSGGVATDEAATRRVEYLRAMRACLEARNYSVR